MSTYDWVDVKVMGTFLVMRTEATLRDVYIEVGDPSEWSIYHVPKEKRIDIHLF